MNLNLLNFLIPYYQLSRGELSEPQYLSAKWMELYTECLRKGYLAQVNEGELAQISLQGYWIIFLSIHYPEKLYD